MEARRGRYAISDDPGLRDVEAVHAYLTVLSHPDLRGLRRLCLFTRDAHSLYARFGFGPTEDPSRFMDRRDRRSYL